MPTESFLHHLPGSIVFTHTHLPFVKTNLETPIWITPRAMHIRKHVCRPLVGVSYVCVCLHLFSHMFIIADCLCDIVSLTECVHLLFFACTASRQLVWIEMFFKTWWFRLDCSSVSALTFKRALKYLFFLSFQPVLSQTFPNPLQNKQNLTPVMKHQSDFFFSPYKLLKSIFNPIINVAARWISTNMKQLHIHRVTVVETAAIAATLENSHRK